MLRSFKDNHKVENIPAWFQLILMIKSSSYLDKIQQKKNIIIKVNYT